MPASRAIEPVPRLEVAVACGFNRDAVNPLAQTVPDEIAGDFLRAHDDGQGQLAAYRSDGFVGVAPETLSRHVIGVYAASNARRAGDGGSAVVSL